MFKTVSPKNDEIFAPHAYHFIILFLTLFSLLFVFTVWIYWDNVFIAFQRKFIVPQIEKKFGFRGRREKIKPFEYEVFSIESVEPGGLFDQAGFKPGDLPIFSGCRFFVNGKTNEAMFYTQLNSIEDGNISVLTISNIDDYRIFITSKGTTDLPERMVYLSSVYRVCLNPR